MPPAQPHPHRSTSSQRPPASGKSLTPKRKHRKMLKDGTSEVWPEAVETLFVEGLRQYWDSPWASFSRGRSRWRNAYLVEYLQKAGVIRSKKQVASHIQVLRNMWKGEPEFQLVAGADDATSESDSAGDKGASLKDEDSDFAYPVSPSTPGSTGSFDDYVAPKHSASALRHVALPPALSIKTEELGELAPLPGFAPALPSPASSASPSAFSFLAPAPASPGGALELHPGLSFTADMVPRTASSSAHAHAHAHAHARPVKPEPAAPVESHGYASPGAAGAAPQNRITSLSLWADGMVPLSVDVDALSAPHAAPARVAFRVRLTIPAPEDMQCPPLLHGFSAAVSLAAPWAAAGRCSTAVYAGGVCAAEEVAELVRPAAAGSPAAVVAACLPDSWLGRCRWLDAAAHTMICQKIVVDGETLAVIVYDLDRSRSSSGRSGPAAALTGFKKWPGSAKTSPLPSPVAAAPSSSHYVTPRDFQQAGPAGVPPTRQQCAFVNTTMAGSALHGFPHFAPSMSFC